MSFIRLLVAINILEMSVFTIANEMNQKAHTATHTHTALNW